MAAPSPGSSTGRFFTDTQAVWCWGSEGDGEGRGGGGGEKMHLSGAGRKVGVGIIGGSVYVISVSLSQRC